MVVNLLDKRETLVDSTHDEATGRHTKIISYYCTTPGKYWITTSYVNEDKACCALLLGTL